MITLERDYDRALGVRPSVSAVVLDARGRVLLQQRSDGGRWGSPGGSVEPGESLAAAVVRSVREETGFAVVPRRLIPVCSGPPDETLSLGRGRPDRLPRTLLPNHRVRIRDARARRAAAFIR